MMRRLVALLVAAAAALPASPAEAGATASPAEAGATPAQMFSQRGFIDSRLVLYPQTAPNDTGRAIGDALFRYEAAWTATPWLKIDGALDARADTHHQTERSLRLDWQDRGLRRPAFSARRFSATLHRGRATFEIGKQFIRWGKADILNPTDRFAPRDYLAVVDNDFLGVLAARFTWEADKDSIDLVWQPRFTPSRTPLLNQRWTVVPSPAESIPLFDGGSRFPGGSMFGARWNHLGHGHEYSLSFYDGRNHLPLLDARAEYDPFRVNLKRYFPRMRMYGADAAVPLRWLTLKGEAGYFTSSTIAADEYLLYVIQVERQSGEWSFAGGYSGEHVTRRRTLLDFAPDRGLSRSFLGRAAYTIDPNRSVAFEAAVRQNGDGSWLKAEYTHLIGKHWRALASITWIRGAPGDFLGQYRRNSHSIIGVRYSF